MIANIRTGMIVGARRILRCGAARRLAREQDGAAAVEFASAGIAVVEMEGGFEAWEKSGLPVAREGASS